MTNPLKTALRTLRSRLKTILTSSNIPPPTTASRTTPSAPVTARTSAPTPPSAKTNTEWTQTLRDMSAIISSRTWSHGSDMPEHAHTNAHDRLHAERHAAARDVGVTGRLPATRWVDVAEGVVEGDLEGARVVGKVEGRLRQNEVLELFDLRRRDIETWDALAIARRFGVDEGDVKNLVAFSRNYMGRLDSDGVVRGYYNTDVENTISRFERD